MELLIPLNSRSGTPVYEQIYAYIREEIKHHRLTAKTRLPSTRRMAEHLKISRSTVQMAYDQLMSEGYIEAVPCKGYFVALIEGMEPVSGPPSGPQTSCPAYLPEPEEPKWKVDFSPRGIDLDHFPFEVWRKLSRNILVDDKKEVFSSGHPQGQPGLRRAVAAYLYSARGVNCAPEQILVGAGNEYLLMLLHQILEPDAVVAMENPTYKQAYRVLASLGHPIAPVAMDAYGMEAGLLEQTQASVAYVMPSHNYPMGLVMPVKRRRQLLEWAGMKKERYIIEDDYDSEFRYRGKPIPALQGMDRQGKVIYMGTFSRAIAPAIRVSYMVLPQELLKRYRERAGFYASTVSRIDQEVLTRFLEDGYFERHLNRMRAVYKNKHDCMMANLKSLEPYFTVGGDNAGVHLLLTSRTGRQESELVRLAQEVQVKVYGLSECRPDPAVEQTPDSSSVILGYATMSEDEIREGIRLLHKTWIGESSK